MSRFAALALVGFLAFAIPAHAGSKQASKTDIRVTVQRVTSRSGSYVVLLQTAGGKIVVPIWIGLREAQAIQMGLSKVAPPRPLTHDLLRNVLKQMGGKIEKVSVIAMRKNVFIGVLTIVDRRGRRHHIDARPSDLIALAVAAGAPIFVSQDVLSRAGVRHVPSSQPESGQAT